MTIKKILLNVNDFLCAFDGSILPYFDEYKHISPTKNLAPNYQFLSVFGSLAIAAWHIFV